MKKIILVLSILLLTGCDLLSNNSINSKEVYTTIYPTKYLINYLYGEEVNINSIYPSGVDFKEYTLSDKKLNEYAKSALFVYNSLDTDRNYAVEMININPEIKLIDVALNMKQVNEVPISWLNPYNYLMMAKNTKESLKEYITDPYIKQKIGEKYDTLEYELSKLDATYQETLSNAKYDIIIANKDLFKFLEKYGITVISLEEDIKEITIGKDDTLGNISNKYNIPLSEILTYNNKKDEAVTIGEKIKVPIKTIDKSNIELVKKLINDKNVSYIYTDDDTLNETINNLITTYKIEKVKINTMYSIDGGITNTNDNYITIMNSNLELFLKELNK